MIYEWHRYAYVQGRAAYLRQWGGMTLQRRKDKWTYFVLNTIFDFSKQFRHA